MKKHKNIKTKKLKNKKDFISLFFCFSIFGFFSFSFFLSPYNLYAKEINIVYTGETHAMLYPCQCPIEPDGGIARRGSLIKELRKKNPDILLLDSGGFFGGGVMDEYTQNTELDKERTIINLKAMETMGYDAVNVGDDELNFGRDFMEERIKNTKIPFLSSNLELDKSLPFLIKDVQGVKIGIIGICARSVISKSSGIGFIEPTTAVKKTVKKLREGGVNIVVLLSHLGEADDINLIKEAQGIDILVAGHSRSKGEAKNKIGSTLLVRPSWQGRRVGILSLTVEDNKITGYKVTEERLSDKIKDDSDVQLILPKCFSDSNCKKEGSFGVCRDSGKLSAKCWFTEAAKINLTIIRPKICIGCNHEPMINYLKGIIPSMAVSYLYYPADETNKLINDLGIKALPVYLLDKHIDKEISFNILSQNLEDKGSFYMLKQQFTGVGYFIDRKQIKGKFDLFMSLYDKNTAPILDAVKEYRPAVHFLAVQRSKTFDTANGGSESEEYLRSVCVRKYYPRYFFDYIGCRAKNINSSWWEDCLPAGEAGAVKMDTNKIKACAKGVEGFALLSEDIKINKEIQVMMGPVYLIDNQQAFSSQGAPSKEELKKIFE